LTNKYSYIDDYLKINGGHFIRFENVSLKNGKHGCIPYTSFKQILESMVTSRIAHSPVYDRLDKLQMYMIPWVNINEFKEYRVFVYEKKITAVSQQNLYASNEILKNLEPDVLTNTIHKHIDILVEHFNKVVKPNIILENYVYDFALLPDDKPYFIEINSYGKEYTSGSSLFHWIIDESKLYSKTGDIYFRYTV
jgi:hypothetical protein